MREEGKEGRDVQEWLDNLLLLNDNSSIFIWSGYCETSSTQCFMGVCELFGSICGRSTASTHVLKYGEKKQNIKSDM